MRVIPVGKGADEIVRLGEPAGPHQFFIRGVLVAPQQIFPDRAGKMCIRDRSKVDGLVSRMFDYYIHNPGQLPDEFAAIREAEGAPRAVCDYIAGMTDNYALEIYHTLFIPRSWSIQLK